MPAQTSDLDAVTSVVSSADGLGEAVKTMLLEGLPFAVKEGCTHAYQKQFMSLAGGVLTATKQSATEELAAIEADLKTVEGELESLKATEAEHNKVVEEAIQGTEQAEAGSAAATKTVSQAEKEHKVAESDSAAFLKRRQEELQEKSRVAAIVEGALRLLVDGGWDDEDTKANAVAAVEGLLGDVKADKVILAAAPQSLGQKPDSRAQYDKMAVDEVMKILPAHLADLESKLKASEEEEVDKKAENLGLWAIADCARDDAMAALEAYAVAQEKQALGELELKAGQKRTKQQEANVAERTTKRARITERLAQVDEAMASVERIQAGAKADADGDACA